MASFFSTDLEAMKEVLEVSCSPNFVRDFSLEESVWLGHFTLVNFSEPSDCTLLRTCERCMSCASTKPRSVRGAQCMDVVWTQQLFRCHSKNLRDVFADPTQSRDVNCWEQKNKCSKPQVNIA